MSTEVAEAFRLKVREKFGSSASNKLRREGMVPGILYGADKENISLAVDVRDIEKGLNTTSFFTSIYNLNIDGVKEQAMVRDVQYHPVNDLPIHIDFMRVSKGARVHVRVPVVFKNDLASPGIKRGGVLNVILHSLDVTCSVEHIPDHIEIDLTGLEIGHSIQTANINLGEGVAVTYPERDVTLATIAAPTVHKAGEGAGAEGETTQASPAKS